MKIFIFTIKTITVCILCMFTPTLLSLYFNLNDLLTGLLHFWGGCIYAIYLDAVKL